MKRRRGSKKGRLKKPKLASTNEAASTAVISSNAEDNSGADDGDDDVDSGMDAETEPTPSPPRATPPETIANVDTLGRPNSNLFGKAVYTRVKVKIKKSNTLEPQRTSPTQSDTDKSSQQVGSEKQAPPSEKMEDSGNSLSETNGGGVSGNTALKPTTGIKIKSSRGLGSSSMSPCSNTEPGTEKGDKIEKKDVKFSQNDSKRNEQELIIALEVIRKIMKMDAAEPFNIPVNPVTLGIPDYFDVIDTPMDFGTICSNLEKDLKYKNSEDVFIDVQHIWNNCYKYNNRGDYIVELMKRVKKAFIKSWTAAGLFNDQTQESPECNPVKDPTPSSEGNTPVNGSTPTPSVKKFHGLKKHKDGCQCAICVMMRRRQEREEIARLVGGPTYVSDDSLGEDMKTERNSRGESPFGEYALSNMEDSPDANAEMEKKGQDLKVGHLRDFYNQQNEDDLLDSSGKQEVSQDLQSTDRPGDENGTHHHTPQLGPGGDVSNGSQEEMLKQNEDGSAAVDQQKPKELLDKNQRDKMLENLRYLENPMLLKLYGTLFTDNSQSFWSGPHSLVGQKPEGSNRHSSLISTISSYMK